PEFWHTAQRLDLELSHAIKQGNCEESQRLIAEAVEAVRKNRLPLEAVRGVCFAIVNIIIKVQIALQMEIGSKMKQSIEGIYSIPFETVGDLEMAIKSLCEDVCWQVMDKKESKNFALLDGITAFVEENYKDNMISLDMIADRFGVT